MEKVIKLTVVGCLCLWGLIAGQIALAQSWEFNTNGNREGWSINNVESWSVNGGIFYIDPASSDPYIERTGLSLSASSYNTVRIRMASNAPDGQGQIFFSTSTSNFWSQDKSVWFVVNNQPGGNAGYQEYDIFMARNSLWQGTITGIRIDPAQNGISGNSDTIGIDYIRPIAATFTINNAYATPNSGAAGSTTTITYNVSSGASLQVLLGASIRPASGGSDLSDPANDRSLSLSQGDNTVTRPFVVPSGASAGTYHLVVSLVLDVNNNGIIDSNDRNLDFKQFNNAFTVSANTGSIQVNATLNGQAWSGSVNYQLTGAQTINGTSVPQSFTNRPTGSYTLGSVSGGPSGASFTSITPSATQTLNAGVTITFTLNYTASPPALDVTPSSLSFGDVTVEQCSANQSFTVRNVGGGTLNGTASVDTPFSIVSGGSFNNLGANQSAQVTVRFCPTTTGSATRPVSFSSNGGNINRSVLGNGISAPPPAGTLSVAPSDGLSASGVQGGPFSPSSKSYTLSNPGGTSINWSAAKGQTWVTLSKGSGTLAPGASDTVTVSINSNANSLSAGNYSDTVSFTNTTNGSGNTTRSVSLNVTNAQADLSVSITASPGHLPVDHPLTYTVTVRNNGPSTATGVTLSVKWALLQQVEVSSAVSTQGACHDVSNQLISRLVCELGSLSSNSQATVTAVVKPKVRSLFRTTADVVSTTADPNTTNDTAATETIVTYIPVIFIPGIRGSELYRQNPNGTRDRLWPSLACPSNWQDYSERHQLELNDNGTDPKDASSDIRVGDVIREACFFDPVGRNYYKDLLNFLEFQGYREPKINGKEAPLPYPHDCNAVNSIVQPGDDLFSIVQPGDDLFAFPYDWRKDLTTVSEFLNQAIACIKSRTNSEKVDVIAHSMGGLIIRHCINTQPDCARSTRKFITVATPHNGAPKAYCAIHRQLHCDSLSFHLRTLLGLRESVEDQRNAAILATNFPSAYQLMPPQDFFASGKYILDLQYPSEGYTTGPVRSAQDTYSKWYDLRSDLDVKLAPLPNPTLVTKAAEFWQGMGYSRLGSPNANFAGDAFVLAAVSVNTTIERVVVKTRCSDPIQMLLFPSCWNLSFTISETATAGDGVVLLDSALGVQLDPASTGTLCRAFTQGEHLGVIRRAPTHNVIKAILLEGADCGRVSFMPGFSPATSTPQKKGDFTLHHLASPVTARVYDAQGNFVDPRSDEGSASLTYFHLGEDTIFLLDNARGPYRIELEATDNGDFVFTQIKYQGEQAISSTNYGLIEITANSKATVAYDPSSATPPPMQLDYDGDGTVDQVINPAADLSISQLDGPDPATVGNTITYTITVTNNSSSTATNVIVTNQLPSGTRIMTHPLTDPVCSYDSIAHRVTCSISNLSGGSTISFDITVIADIAGTLVNKVTVAGSQGDPDLTNNEALAETTVAVLRTENFETGDFSRFAWQTGGHGVWQVTSSVAHASTYSAVAPVSIGDRQNSYLQVFLEVNAGTISFWIKVSSDSNDYLEFYIDGKRQGRWSGEKNWQRVSFPVPAGRHIFRWLYTKDRRGSRGQDTAWVDDIEFPPIATASPVCPGVIASSSPTSVNYRPTTSKAASQKILEKITNDSGAPIIVRSLEPQTGEPFYIERISPVLPATISSGRSVTFSVHTKRNAGLPPATATSPYFNITLNCGILSSASKLGVPRASALRLQEIQAKLQARQIRVTASGEGIAAMQLQLFDLSGRLLVNKQDNGYVLTIPVQSSTGRSLANGVYLYVVRVRGFNGEEYVSEVRKLIILR